MNKHLHIISFDIPFPPSYGGVIDVFFKIKALHEKGVKIHLHCFEYGRKHTDELGSICESVNYYRRKSGPAYLFGSLPYIVSTRSSGSLAKELLKDDHAILFEGLHCCSHLADVRLKNRKKIVRMHNIEHDYYDSLAKVERSFFKRKYFNSEAKKLKKFEQVLTLAANVIAISPADSFYLSEKYKNVSCISPFHPDERVQVREGKGDFVLYHGNLAIGENNEAALFLVNKVFNDLKIPLIIAGNDPSEELLTAAKKNPYISIKKNISTNEIYALIRQAQINILPTFQSTGIKLKLLAALFNGRHCIVNSPMVKGTGLEQLCIVADASQAMKEAVNKFFAADLDEQEKTKREKILLRDFSNAANAEKLLSLI